MSYSSLIDSQLVTAFKMLKDMAKPMTFTKVTGASFDFGSGTLNKTTAAPATFKVVAIDETRPSKDRKTITKTILARSKDIPDLMLYDKFNFESFDWKLGKILKEAGRIWMFEIVREA